MDLVEEAANVAHATLPGRHVFVDGTGHRALGCGWWKQARPQGRDHLGVTYDGRVAGNPRCMVPPNRGVGTDVPWWCRRLVTDCELGGEQPRKKQKKGAIHTIFPQRIQHHAPQLLLDEGMLLPLHHLLAVIRALSAPLAIVPGAAVTAVLVDTAWYGR